MIVKAIMAFDFCDFLAVLEQKIEQEEETNKSSADLRIRKTQVSLNVQHFCIVLIHKCK